MTEPSYNGGCHCGAVRYEVSLDLDKVNVCNCSRCSKLGVIWSFATPDKFKLVSGGSDLTGYRFNRRAIDHRFCAKCGIESFAQGPAPSGAEMIAINVRCLDGVDLDALKPDRFNGRDY
jgi:hypothetical protein